MASSFVSIGFWFRISSWNAVRMDALHLVWSAPLLLVALVGAVALWRRQEPAK